MSTTRLVGLLIVHGRARCPSRGWYAKTTRQGWKGRWVYGLDQQRGQGRGKGAEAQNFPALTGLSGGQGPFTCVIACVRVWCWGMCAAYRLAHCPLQSNSPVRPQTTEATQKTSRQRSKLAEASQEGEKGRGKWKVGDKTQGGGVKKCFVQQKTKTIGGRVKGAKMGSKRLNHVCW